MDCFVEENKITLYLLNPNHLSGDGKCKFFESFGFSLDNWQIMAGSLKEHPRAATLTDTDSSSAYGTKKIFECHLSTPDKRDPCIRTVWQETPEGRWRFITAYPFL